LERAGRSFATGKILKLVWPGILLFVSLNPQGGIECKGERSRRGGYYSIMVEES